MDESLQELEAELKRLTPRRPSAGWEERLTRDLAPATVPAATPAKSSAPTTATNFTSWKWAGWKLAAALGLGTLIGLLLPHRGERTATPAPEAVAATETAPDRTAAPRREPTPAASAEPVAATERYRPVAAANVLYDLKDEGPIQLDDLTPARRLRYRYVDTYTWKNPASNASVRWCLPREEVRVVPVRLN